MMFPITSSKNLEFEHGNGSPRYFLNVDLDDVAPGRTASLPVYWRSNGSHPILKEIYYSEVGGFRIEKGNLQMLIVAVEEAIGALVDHKTLPYYSIQLPNGTRIPVFLANDKLKVEYERIKIAGDNIGEIFHKLGRQLVSMKSIRNENELRVSIFLWRDMKLYPPALVFRDDRLRVWLPIFLQDIGGKIMLNYDIVNLPTKLYKAEDFLTLRKDVVTSCMSKRLISSPHSLFADHVRDEVWKEIKKILLPTDTGFRFQAAGQKHEIAVYQIGSDFLAASRPRIYFGKDPEHLRNVVAEGLKREGPVQSTTDLVIEKKRRRP